MRKIIRISAFVAAPMVLIVLAVAYLYFFTTLPETELNGLLHMVAADGLGLELRIERINRNLWDRAVVEGVTISSRVGGRTPLATISRIEMDYDIGDLLKGNYSLRSLVLDSVHVWLAASGGLLASTGERTKRALLFPAFSVESVLIRSAVIEPRRGEPIFLDSLSSSLVARNGSVQMNLNGLRGLWPGRGLVVRSLSGKLTWDGKGIRIDNLNIATGLSKVSLSGTIAEPPTGGLDLRLTCAPIDLGEVRSVSGVALGGRLTAEASIVGNMTGFGGTALLNGTFMGKQFENVRISYDYANKVLNLGSIRGRIFKADFDGNGFVDFGAVPEKYGYRGAVENLNLKNVAPKLETDFTGDISLDGRGFGEDNFKMRIDCHLDSLTVENYYFDHASGIADFDLRKIRFLPGFAAQYKHAQLSFSGWLEYDGQMDISGQASFGDLEDFTGQLFIRRLGGKGRASFRLVGPTADFSVKAAFSSDSCWAYGLAARHLHLSANLKSFLSHKVGTVWGSWVGGELYSVPADSGFFKASISGERVFLDTVFIVGGPGHIWGQGSYDGTVVPPVFVIDTLSGNIFGNAVSSESPMKLTLFNEETVFDKCGLRWLTGKVEISGVVTNGLDMDIEVVADSFQMGPVLGQIIKKRSFKGKLSGDARLIGNFENPIIDFQAVVDDLAAGEVPLGRLQIQARYEDSYLDTKEATLASGHGRYRLSGKLPVRLPFGETSARFADLPIDMSLTGRGTRLVLLEALIPNLEAFATDFSFEVRLEGTYSNPSIGGSGVLQNGNLKVLELVNPLTDVRAYLRMENETVFIDSAFATVPESEKDWTKALEGLVSSVGGKSKQPSIVASGTIKLKGLSDLLYDLRLQGKDIFFISDAYDVRGVADFDVTVEGETPPLVKGKILLRRLDVRDEFSKFVPPDYDPSIVVEDSASWDLDLEVASANNLWIKNSTVDAEFGGNLLIQRHVGLLRILGSLDVIRGTYSLPGMKFRVKSGKLEFKNVAVVDPDIDFLVTTRIRHHSQASSGFQNSIAELRVSGTIVQPRISTGPQSDLSREDILKYILTGGAVNPALMGAEQRELLRRLGPFLSLIPVNITGQGYVDEFQIYSSERGLAEISLSKYILPDLYVRFARPLSLEASSAFGVEYYLNDNISFRASQGLRGSRDEGISFDVNLNYEY